MDKPDTPSKDSGEEKSEIETHFFYKRQLMDLYNNNSSEEEDREDMKPDRIDMPR